MEIGNDYALTQIFRPCAIPDLVDRVQERKNSSVTSCKAFQIVTK